jgi:hypothetical protein
MANAMASRNRPFQSSRRLGLRSEVRRPEWTSSSRLVTSNMSLATDAVGRLFSLASGVVKPGCA